MSNRYAWLQELKGCHGKGADAWCGPGWRELVEACDKQMAYVDPNYRIDQIKEKFGTLRFYWSRPNNPDLSEDDNDTVFEILRCIANNAEMRSQYRCEECGTQSKVTTSAGDGYWILTLCDSCRGTK